MNRVSLDRLMEESERARDYERAASNQETSIEVRVVNGQVVLSFGAEVSRVGFTPEMARTVAEGLRQGANQIDQPRKKHRRVGP